MFFIVKNKLMKNKIMKISGLILIITSIIILFYNIWFEIKQELYDAYIIDTYFETPEIISIPNIEEIDTEPPEEKTPIEEEIIQEEYIAILEIPKINFKRGLVAKDSINNTVDKNIMTMPISTMPDVDKGNFVLAAHSGIGYYAFFKHLYKLKLNDSLYIYYNNIKYEYLIKDIYHDEKDGTVAIHKETEDTTITLITCKYKDETKHTIYVASLFKKGSY